MLRLSRRKNHSRTTQKAVPSDKVCPKCETAKPLSEFGRDAARPDGRFLCCKKCRRAPNRVDQQVMELAARGLKVCTKCLKHKPMEAFDKDSSKSLGRRSRCKKCHRETRRNRRPGHTRRAMDELEREGFSQCYRCYRVHPLQGFVPHPAYETGYCRLCLNCDETLRKSPQSKRRGRDRDYTRWEVFEDDRFMCYICEDVLSPDTPANERKSLSIDHVVPLSRGGRDERDNVRTCCLGCNNDKGNLFLEEFLAKIGRLVPLAV